MAIISKTAIERYIENQEYIFENRNLSDEQIQNERIQKIKIVVLKIITTGIGVAGSIPNIALSLKLGENIFLLGPVLATGNFITFSSLTIWSFHKIIDDEITLDPTLISEISNFKIPILLNTITKLIVLGMGVLSEVPRAFTAYVYNNEQVIYPVLSFSSGTARPVYSLNLTFNRLITLEKLSSVEKEIEKFKNVIINNIQKLRKYIKLVSVKKRNEIVDRFKMQNTESAIDLIKKIIDVKNDIESVSNKLTSCEKIKNVVSKGIGFSVGTVTTIALSTFNFWLSKNAAEYLWDNEIFEYATGGAVVLCSVYLTSMIMYGTAIATSDRLFFDPKQLILGHANCSVIIPKIRGALGLCSIIISLLSLGPCIEATNEYFNGVAYYLMLGPVPLGIFFFLLNAVTDLVDQICDSAILYKIGAQSHKDLIRLDRSLVLIADIIQKSCILEFSKFATQLPENYLNIDDQIEMTKNKLSSYLSEKINEKDFLVARD